jgi:NAD(P)-dependent dehydrogenase (short-subunit alcohol dehydrogenase family)
MTSLSSFDLHGRVAVVTGSSRGLGRAMAVALAEAGAAIVVNGRDPAAAAETESLVRATGAEAMTVLADVTSRPEVERMRDEAMERFGAIDILVNNAGVCIHRPALEVTDEEWRHVLGTNVDGVWIPSQVFGGHMVARRRGVIVNIGSMSAGIVNRPQWQPAYNASKAAVHHLTRSLAAEWAPMGCGSTPSPRATWPPTCRRSTTRGSAASGSRTPRCSAPAGRRSSGAPSSSWRATPRAS